MQFVEAVTYQETKDGPELTTTGKRWWAKWRKNQESGYGRAVLRFAERWATLMEQRMHRGEKLEDCADATLHEADHEGITGFMYGVAVSGLAHAWVHGDQLRRWHNGEYGQPDAKGTVNPAVLVIGE
jgi:hypothetical protein